MINFNGNITPSDTFFLNHTNRGLRYGDALFEAIRVVNGKIFFWEDHYLRLMASMRILRMEIPMDFTMEFLEEQILKTIAANTSNTGLARVRLIVFRNDGGFYLPEKKSISYIIETTVLETPFFVLEEKEYEVELFKDYYINADMLSNLKTNNKILNVIGSVYAQENGYHNCLLLNNAKQVVEALNGNLFMIKGNMVKTPSLKDGCLNGIIRKKLIEIVKKLDDYTFEEASISPFELQKADELFVTNAIMGIQPITKYRKKEYTNTVAKDLMGKLNVAARLG
ncbi:aminotransferase class IV [Costertonia aggregata]|uniref:branched-chain-amino-acid transaminase n=1 Tax=Costertonia aggregata TaxID=343403 RepID=A0A7H9ATD1_9FLAO|nr:aminotransferase class IV [Costertonia aggregata]QLG46728.1 aminotransferase class IV [Costertonia aggregata]